MGKAGPETSFLEKNVGVRSALNALRKGIGYEVAQKLPSLGTWRAGPWELTLYGDDGKTFLKTGKVSKGARFELRFRNAHNNDKTSVACTLGKVSSSDSATLLTFQEVNDSKKTHTLKASFVQGTQKWAFYFKNYQFKP